MTQVIQVTQSSPADTTPPSVAIASPAAGATVSGTVRISASASDSQSGVATVRFFVDGALIGTATSAPYRANWNTRKATRGQHALTAVAADRAGNSMASTVVTVNV